MTTSHELHLVAAVPAALVGLAVGSFAGVVADRIPNGGSIVRPPSHCDSCGTPLRTVDNIPLVSYLMLGGRCRVCRARIPRRDFVLELVTAALFAAVAIRLPHLAALPAYLVLVTALVALSAIDVQHRRLPSPVIYVSGALGVVLLLVASAVTSNWAAMLHALIGGAACFGAFFLIWFAVPRGMGFGDVRLAGLCGLYLGWLGLLVIPVGIIASFFAAGIPAVALLVMGKVSRKTSIPFGPYLAAGTVIGVLFGPALAHSGWV